MLVGNFSTFSENAKGTNVTWGQFAFDTEAMGSLQRSNPEVSFLFQPIAFWPMMTIIVALLTRLGCFQLLMNIVNLLFCFLDHSGPKNCLSPAFDQFNGVRHFRP